MNGQRGAARASRAVLIAALLFGAGSAPASAQRVRTALLPDTATVGDVIRAVVWVDLPADWKVALPDSLPGTDTLENAGKRQVSERTVQGGQIEVTGTYPVTPWRTGDLSLPRIRVHFVGAGMDSLVQASFPRLHVRSVLPADTAKQQPKPPRDVLGPNRLLWPWIVAAILALLLLALLARWLWRRWRRRAETVALPVEERLPPRERALRELDAARAAGLLDGGEVKTFYVRSSEAVRHYLDALNPAWGADRTTSELIPRLRVVDLGVAAGLARLLDRADLVKFARLRPSGNEALDDWAKMRAWVEAFPEPGAQEESDREARAA
jgi:hypothetical protein